MGSDWGESQRERAEEKETETEVGLGRRLFFMFFALSV